MTDEAPETEPPPQPEVVEVIEQLPLTQQGQAARDTVCTLLGNVHTTDAVNFSLAIAARVLEEINAGREIHFVSRDSQLILGGLLSVTRTRSQQVVIRFTDGTELGPDLLGLEEG